MKIAISAESTIDLPQNLLDEYEISIIPFQVLLGNDEYKDGEITPNDIFEFVKKHKILPKTSAINQVQYQEYFEELLKDNEAIIHFCLSSKLSSAYSNAVQVAKNMKNVYVVDTKSLSTGIALLAIFARECVRNGDDAQVAYEKALKKVDKVQASFVVDKLDYLRKGGRCSALAYLGANILGIHPEIVLIDGFMKSGKKYKGKMERVVNDYCHDVLESNSQPNLDIAFLTYTTATDEMRDIAIKYLKDRGFKQIYQTNAGATITSHCGEKTLGILFLNEK